MLRKICESSVHGTVIVLICIAYAQSLYTVVLG